MNVFTQSLMHFLGEYCDPRDMCSDTLVDVLPPRE